MGLHEPRVYRRLVVTLIRNLLVKHSGDVRYDNAIAQSRISVLYAPFISVILGKSRLSCLFLLNDL